ncbi:MAG: hypothetical protein ACR2G4_11725 [Pyrinomonadaceae bacterium]
MNLPGGALADGATLDVQLLLGVEGGGSFRFFVNTEAVISSPTVMGKTDKRTSGKAARAASRRRTTPGAR